MSQGTIDPPPVTCGGCALGQASGTGEGLSCPFIERRYRKGDALSLAGDPASYVWMVKSGSIGLTEGHDAVETVRLPGQFVGLECLVGETYTRTARVLTPSVLCGATREGFFRWLRQSDERIKVIIKAAIADRGLATLCEEQHA